MTAPLVAEERAALQETPEYVNAAMGGGTYCAKANTAQITTANASMNTNTKGLRIHCYLRFPVRFCWAFLTALFAPRIARASLPVRARIELATSAHWRLRFDDLTRELCLETSLARHGTGLPPCCSPRRSSGRRALDDTARRSRCRSRSCPFRILPRLIRPISLPDHLIVPGCIDWPARRIRKPIDGVHDPSNGTSYPSVHPIRNRLRCAVILRHRDQPLFRTERLDDFFPAIRAAFSRKRLEWLLASKAGVSSFSETP